MTDHDRVSTLFLRASALAPEEIRAFLDIECADDPELRGEVEAMLEHDAGHGATAALAARVLGVAAGAVPAAPPVPLPERIGPYRILERIGEGGMGIVYRAEQTEPIRREVALKVIRDGTDSASVVARFEAERQMLASMDHPNIATVLDAGSDAAGRPYFVMERIEGVPITDYCRTRNLAKRERLILFLDVCRGVRHAHQRGVIHRDLKPANVLVTASGGTPVPKVIDFSIAKALGAPAVGTEFRTRTGQVVGTLEYMSPEQASGRVSDVDTRSDVYALGGVLCELMTERLPLELHGLSLHEAVRRIAEEPPRFRRVSKTAATLRMDQDLETIVGKCLQKEPDRRYGSAAELAEDIERHLDSRPILARPPSATYQLRKLVGRHRVAFGAASLLFLFLVIFSITVTIQLGLQRREHARADAQARKADRVADFMSDAFQGALTNLGPQATVRSALDRALQALSENPIADEETDAEIRIRLGNTFNVVDAETAQRLLREGVALLTHRFGSESPRVADAMQALGVNLYYSGKLGEAADLVRRILEIHEKQRPINPIWLADDLSLLGSIERQRRHLGSAEAIFRREITLREPRYHLVVKHNLVSVLLLEGKVSEAKRLFDELATLEIPPFLEAMVAFDRASVACALGNHVEAEASFRKAVETERKLNGEVGAKLLLGHGRCLAHLRRFAEAEAAMQAAVETQRKKPPALPLDARASISLASLFLAEHHPERAEPLLQEALSADRKKFGDDSFNVAADLTFLGTTAEQRGRWPEAEEDYRRSLAMREKMLEPDDLEIGYGLTTLAGFLARRGRLVDAEPLQARGLSILERRFDAPSPSLAAAKAEWTVALDGPGRNARGQADVAPDDALLARLLRP